MSVERIPTAGVSREDWLAERRKSLGGSDMGAVLGLNRWSTPYSVWAEKTGRVPDKEDTEAMRIGRDLEPYVASRFAEASGKKVERLNAILRNDAAPYLHANIDRRVVGEKSGLECKTASALSMRHFAGGDFPETYYAQCVTYLAVTGWARWYLAALILGRGFLIYQITTDPEDKPPEWCEGSVYVSPDELAGVRNAAERFWTQYVDKDTPPPVDGLEPTGDALAAIYADGGNPDALDLFGREDLFRQYKELTESKAALEREIERLKQTLQEDMGNAEEARCPGWRVTWKPQTRRTLDVKRLAKERPDLDLNRYYKETKSRTFRIREDKPKEDE